MVFLFCEYFGSLVAQSRPLGAEGSNGTVEQKNPVRKARTLKNVLKKYEFELKKNLITPTSLKYSLIDCFHATIMVLKIITGKATSSCKH